MISNMKTYFSQRWINRPKLKILLLLELYFLFVPILAFFYIPTETGVIPGSACYFFSLVFLPMLCERVFKEKQLYFPPWYITIWIAFVIVLAVVRIPQYGLSRSILHWMFGMYMLIVILNANKYLDREDWLDILETGAILYLITHMVFMLTVNWNTLCDVLLTYFWGNADSAYGVYLASLTRGGRSIEASWLALFSLFVRGEKRFWYSIYVGVFACIGGARAGMIAIALASCYGFAQYLRNGYDTKKKREVVKGIIIILVILGAMFISGIAQANIRRLGYNIPVIPEILGIKQRANDTVSFDHGVEVQLSGRKQIWQKVPTMIKDNPFGYGVGNAMRVMKSKYGFSSYEDVVHNVFLQWTVDEGIIGGIVFATFVLLFVIRQVKKKKQIFQIPEVIFLLIYLILSMIQYHGAEALMIYILGSYFCVEKIKLLCIGHNMRKEDLEVL